ncbi:ABC-type molybdate transport system permease subunit [Methylohalomonas lacus]|uniref:ABC-type molybdate transport system permease subunit n=1 Tax=Methylohalomonas lacus TaxID=398773 RepID=A0AAE3HMA6_9GAMM|nr:multidrug transporter [Methylohalomonas lacus]MCS3903092.1 ABC-type molybdate transport system permease subunit [Methylohalomonas lacus]
MHRLFTIALLAGLLAAPVNAADNNGEAQRSYSPTATDMIVDGLVIRPLSLAATVVGSALFVVTLPFSAIGGNVDEAGQALVADPAQATFGNCLGCIPGHQERRRRHD